MAIVERTNELKDAARRANDGAEQALPGAERGHRGGWASRMRPEGALGALIEAAEAAIAEPAKRESQRQKAKDRRAESCAGGRLKAALEEDARWRCDWREACAGSWLGDAELSRR